MREVAQAEDADFRGRLEAVQAAVDAYLRAKITRDSAGAGRKEVIAG